MDKKVTPNELIEALGGHAQVAADLGYEHKGGAERVNNWRTRGIPPKVYLDNYDYFEGGRLKAERAAA